MTDIDSQKDSKAVLPHLFPRRIKVKGFPLMLCGWNSVYERIEEFSDGCPVYYLESYNFLWAFSIIGVRIFREDGVWKMKRDGDSYCMSSYKYGSTPQGDPFGFWKDGIYVQPV